MAQTLTVSATLDMLDRGKGIADIDAALAAPTSVDLLFANSTNELFFLSNGTVGNVTATLNGQVDENGRSANEVIVVPAGKVGYFSFMKAGMFNVGAIASITLSSIAAGVKVGLVRLRHT